jgi:hypothetical protein
LKRLQKRLLVVVVLLVGALALESIREKIEYDRFSNKLESATRSLEPGVPKDRIKQLVGDPEWVKLDDNGEFWYWAAANHQGVVWRWLGLTWLKGHRTLVVQLNREGKLVGFWDGIN